MAFSDNYRGLAVFDSAGQTLVGKRKISAATWAGFADTDVLSLKDKNTADLFTTTGGAGTEKVDVPHLVGLWVEDLETTTLGGGKLYVHYQ